MPKMESGDSSRLMDKNKFVQVVNVNVISASDFMVFVFDPKYMRSLECWYPAKY
jgi:hypothetical protein